MKKFLGYYERPTGTVRTTHIRRNGVSVDPAFVHNGTGSVGAGTATIFSAADGNISGNVFVIYSVGDPSYVGTEFQPGVNLGKNAAGVVFAIIPSRSDNTVIWGSFASYPGDPASPEVGWIHAKLLSGAFSTGNWIISAVLVNPSTATMNAELALWIFYNSVGICGPSGADGWANPGGNTGSLQWSPVFSFQTGATASVALAWSMSVTGIGSAGDAGPLVLSGQYLCEEWYLQITTASSKSGAKLLLRTNG